jgi:hypothetical protein
MGPDVELAAFGRETKRPYESVSEKGRVTDWSRSSEGTIRRM